MGVVVRPHGLRGELVVDVRTDSPQERFAPGAVLLRSLPDGAASDAVTSEVLAAHDRITTHVVDTSTVGVQAARDLAALVE